jgi:hypothetical protein
MEQWHIAHMSTFVLEKVLRITIESMRRLVIAVVEIFEDEYLRSPNQNDITRLLAIAEEIGFLGMLDSIDCMQ